MAEETNVCYFRASLRPFWSCHWLWTREIRSWRYSMKEHKKVSGVEKHSAWLHFTSVDSAIFAGRWYMYGRFDVMDLVGRVDFSIDWRE